MTEQQQSFGTWLRERAEAAGYDTAQRGWIASLAREAGVDRGQLSRALNDNVIPRVEKQEALAAALGVPFLHMLIRSGTIHQAGETQAPGPGPVTLRAYARAAGVPQDRLDLWLHTVEAVTETFTN
jgi:transcriptional regulator with XRE-family HTH domain